MVFLAIEMFWHLKINKTPIQEKSAKPESPQAENCMENGFRQTVMFCFDVSEKLHFDGSRLLLFALNGEDKLWGRPSCAVPRGASPPPPWWREGSLHSRAGLLAPSSPRFPILWGWLAASLGAQPKWEDVTEQVIASRAPEQKREEWRWGAADGLDSLTISSGPEKNTCPQPLRVFPAETVSMSSLKFPTCLGHSFILNYFYQHAFCYSFPFYFSFYISRYVFISIGLLTFIDLGLNSPLCCTY